MGYKYTFLNYYVVFLTFPIAPKKCDVQRHLVANTEKRDNFGLRASNFIIRDFIDSGRLDASNSAVFGEPISPQGPAATPKEAKSKMAEKNIFLIAIREKRGRDAAFGPYLMNAAIKACGNAG